MNESHTTPQHVHVQRFPGSPLAQLVCPDDRSWAVQVSRAGEAVFFRRVAVESPGGVDEHAYVDAELPSVAVDDAGVQPQDEALRSPCSPGPIDYEVRPGPEGDWEGARPGFWATMNVRSITYWGETEHEAVRALVNDVARLCTAGQLDHTGRPVVGNPRRRRAVNGG